MSKSPPRLIFTVTPHEGGWAVEHDGAYSDMSGSRDEVMASASRRARAVSAAGGLTQVVVKGEPRFFTGAR
jgi:hypothetical protein